MSLHPDPLTHRDLRLTGEAGRRAACELKTRESSVGRDSWVPVRVRGNPRPTSSRWRQGHGGSSRRVDLRNTVATPVFHNTD